MAYYNSPEAMYNARSEQFKKSGDQYWALAKSGGGAEYYGRANFCYAQAAENKHRSEQAKKENRTWER